MSYSFVYDVNELNEIKEQNPPTRKLIRQTLLNRGCGALHISDLRGQILSK